jgi:hypothetical protein
MPKFEIWEEGYCIQGNDGTAFLRGEAEGADFREACLRYFEKHPNPDFNPSTLAVWGCRLFDNEADARKAFG